MRTAHRQFDPGLIDQIEQSPQQFEFFQAVRLLDRFFRAHGRGRGNDEGAVSDLIRFRNSLQLAFAPSQIEAALIEADTAAPESAHRSRSIRYVQITPAFMGMLGMHGTLPVHYTESVERRERFERDRSARDQVSQLPHDATALRLGLRCGRTARIGEESVQVLEAM